MKKKIIILLILLIIIVVTIVLILLNKTKIITCSSFTDMSANGYNYETYYTIHYKKDIVFKVEIEEIIKSENSDILKMFEKQFTEQYEYNNKVYGGYEYNVLNSGNRVRTEILIDYTKLDIDKFVKNNSVMDEYFNNNKLTIDNAIRYYEDSGATCDK
jgi:hypothetical protein